MVKVKFLLGSLFSYLSTESHCFSFASVAERNFLKPYYILLKMSVWVLSISGRGGIIPVYWIEMKRDSFTICMIEVELCTMCHHIPRRIENKLKTQDYMTKPWVTKRVISSKIVYSPRFFGTDKEVTMPPQTEALKRLEN